MGAIGRRLVATDTLVSIEPDIQQLRSRAMSVRSILKKTLLVEFSVLCCLTDSFSKRDGDTILITYRGKELEPLT